MSVIIILSLILSGIHCQRKDSIKTDSLYASSLFRQNYILEGIPEIQTIENVSSVSICLIYCMRRRPDCKAFNWGDSQCVLISDSICANETLVLTPKSGYSYYDIMDSPEFEAKHLKEKYCRQMGKCSGRCYPRKPHYVNTPMTWTEAREYCNDLGRALPQPKSSEEQTFFAKFIKKLLEEKPEFRNHKDMKFWFGLSDREMEGFWVYVDNTPVSDNFSAWALGQPGNGGVVGIGKEDCAAISERVGYKWIDTDCRDKYKFFCA